MWSQKIIFVVAMLIALTASIPVLESSPHDIAEASESWEDKMTRYRLPNNSIPRLYRINIEPNMSEDDLTWNGESSIDLEILTVTRIITLHAYKNLVIDENSTKLVDSAGEKHEPIQQIRDHEVEFLKLVFDQDIPAGNYTLSLRYRGTETSEPIGFYKASFASDYPSVAATHFEATTARRAFPCWDEPGLKARYRMSIKHYPNYTAISNMPAIEEIDTGDGKIVTTFDTTPVMSVYLLTFVISGYESLSNEYGNVTVWADENELEGFVHILNTSQQVVDFMEAYTGLPFGFPRLGSVVLPLYSSAATEHWGLVSYSTRMARYVPSTDTTLTLERVNFLIAHELSHTWFGNRVTPLWWDDLWLNEGFATYFKYIIMADIYGYSDLSGLFVVRNNQQTAFPLDLHENDIYIRWKPITNEETRKLFGRITYRKGAAIVHMFRKVLTDEVFQSGIRKYLTRHSYEAVEADDLMAALQEAYDENNNDKAPLNVKETMMTWLMQTGCPIINITRNYTTGETKVEQRSISPGDRTKKWWIPLNYATKTNPNFSSTAPLSWISDKEENVVINGIDKDDWVIFNIQASGYYQVDYDHENWKRIVEYMNTDNYKKIDVINRAQIVHDVFTLVKSDPSLYGKLFWQLTKYLARETEYLPWTVAMTAFRYLDELLSGTRVHGTLQKYILGLMNNFIEKVGYETSDDDDYITKLSKIDVIEWACVSGHAGCAEFSARRLLQYIDNPIENRLHPDNELSVFCSGFRGLNDTSAQLVMDWIIAYDMPVNYIGCTKNHEVHRNYLNSFIRNMTNDPYRLVTGLQDIFGKSDENFAFGIDYVMENYQSITNNDTGILLGSSSSTINDIFFPLVKSHARLEKYKQILDLKIIEKNKESSRADLVRDAEEKVANMEETVAMFENMWDQQLFPNNLIDDTNIETK